MVHWTRRNVVTGLAATAAAGATVPHPAVAQAYPGSLTIKFVVPYPPAGATDIVGRTISDALGQLWKTTTIVDNVPGAGANIGMDKVARGPSDGTQVLIVPPNITTNQFLYQKLSFNPETDVIPISQVARLPNLLCVRKGLPVKSVAELIAYAKANPGKLNYASSGVGTTIHLSAEMFKSLAGVDMVHVPYRGSANALNDLMAGQVDLMFDNLPSIEPQAKAGNVVAIAVTSGTKSALAPDYPTVAEVLPGFDVNSWFGIGVRAGTPQAIVDKLEADVMAVCKQDDVKKRLLTASIESVGSSAKEFREYIELERKRWGKLITELKIKVD
jgi:tripartite-type tricarboxylate transporter receptor subunit TctC